MQKIICVIMSIVIIILNFPTAYASTSDNLSQPENANDTIQKALELFPEFASGTYVPSSNMRSTTSDNARIEVSYSETRSYSDTEQITYTQFSNGGAMLTNSNFYDFDFRYQSTQTGSEISGSNTVVTLNIRAIYVEQEYDGGPWYEYGSFTLSGIRYNISRTGYDWIISTGTPSNQPVCTNYTASTPVLNETASGKAKISYELRWRVSDLPGGYYVSILTFVVGNNGAGVTHTQFE